MDMRFNTPVYIYYWDEAFQEQTAAAAPCKASGLRKPLIVQEKWENPLELNVKSVVCVAQYGKWQVFAAWQAEEAQAGR